MSVQSPVALREGLGDVEEDAKLVPSFVKGERIVLVAAGEVDARVDFRNLGPRSLQVSPDRTEGAGHGPLRAAAGAVASLRASSPAITRSNHE